MRTFLAFIGAPIISALIPGWSYHVNVADRPFLSSWMFFCLIFYVLQTAIGIPAYLLLKRQKTHQVWIYLMLGFIGVALPTLFLALSKPPQEGYDPNFLLYNVLLYPGLLGAGTGLMFWLLARPDKRAVAALHSN